MRNRCMSNRHVSYCHLNILVTIISCYHIHLGSFIYLHIHFGDIFCPLLSQWLLCFSNKWLQSQTQNTMLLLQQKIYGFLKHATNGKYLSNKKSLTRVAMLKNNSVKFAHNFWSRLVPLRRLTFVQIIHAYHSKRVEVSVKGSIFSHENKL